MECRRSVLQWCICAWHITTLIIQWKSREATWNTNRNITSENYVILFEYSHGDNHYRNQRHVVITAYIIRKWPVFVIFMSRWWCDVCYHMSRSQLVDEVVGVCRRVTVEMTDSHAPSSSFLPLCPLSLKHTARWMHMIYGYPAIWYPDHPY